jgi:hypothetical protein
MRDTLINTTADIFQFKNVTATLCSVAFNASRKLDMKVGGVVQATGTRILSDIENFHLQIHVKIADSGGVLELRVDDILDANFTGIPSRAARLTSATCFDKQQREHFPRFLLRQQHFRLQR